jgi:hypothetical protein
VGKYGLEAPSLDGAQWGLGKTGLNDDDTEVLCRLWMKGEGGKLLQLKELNLAHNHVPIPNPNPSHIHSPNPKPNPLPLGLSLSPSLTLTLSL